MPEQTQAEPQPEDQASSQYLDALKQLKVRSHSLSLSIYINIHKYIYIYINNIYAAVTTAAYSVFARWPPNSNCFHAKVEPKVNKSLSADFEQAIHARLCPCLHWWTVYRRVCHQTCGDHRTGALPTTKPKHIISSQYIACQSVGC